MATDTMSFPADENLLQERLAGKELKEIIFGE